MYIFSRLTIWTAGGMWIVLTWRKQLLLVNWLLIWNSFRSVVCKYTNVSRTNVIMTKMTIWKWQRIQLLKNQALSVSYFKHFICSLSDCVSKLKSIGYFGVIKVLFDWVGCGADSFTCSWVGVMTTIFAGWRLLEDFQLLKNPRHWRFLQLYQFGFLRTTMNWPQKSKE